MQAMKFMPILAAALIGTACAGPGSSTVTLYTHCGIEYLDFGGRHWIADLPVRPLHASDTAMKWDDPIDTGEVTNLPDGSLNYVGRRGLVVRLVPAPQDYRPPFCY
jgi:hypothetical protein